MNEIVVNSNDKIENSIYEIRGKQVMLDSDLAKCYECANGTKTINQAVNRHLDRFPDDFYFQLTEEEYNSLRSQLGTLKCGRGQHNKYLPYAFTEQGVAMLSSMQIDNYNRQYNNLTVKYDDSFHDRYFIIDDKIFYHCGSSLNRIGVRTFSINLLEDEFVCHSLLNKIKSIIL